MVINAYFEVKAKSMPSSSHTEKYQRIYKSDIFIYIFDMSIQDVHTRGAMREEIRTSDFRFMMRDFQSIELFLGDI
jgi:hypothetical protein